MTSIVKKASLGLVVVGVIVSSVTLARYNYIKTQQKTGQRQVSLLRLLNTQHLLLEQARQSETQGKSQEAIVFYRRAVSIPINRPEVYRQLGDALLELGCSEEAEQAYLMGAYRDPRRADLLPSPVQFRLSAYYASHRMPEKAIQWLKTAIASRYPPPPDDWKFPERRGGAKPAETPIFEPVEKDMMKLQAFAYSQIAEQFAGHIDSYDTMVALKEYKASVALAPDAPWQAKSWRFIGDVSHKQGDLATAKEAYNKAIAIARRTNDASMLDRSEDGLKRVKATVKENALP